MFKHNSPDCVCCGTGAHFSLRGYTDEAVTLGHVVYYGQAPTLPPHFDGTSSTTDHNTSIGTPITGLVNGSRTVGVDMERGRVLWQLPNGSVRSVVVGETTSVELWATTSDAAGYTLRWVVYHHSWGFASASKTSGTVVSLDAAGDLVQGPYTATPSDGLVDDPIVHCTDPSGNIYYYKGTNGDSPAGNEGTVFRNGSLYSYADGPTSGYTGRAMFHDGTNLHVVAAYSVSGTPFVGLFVAPGGGGLITTKVIDDLADIEPLGDIDVPATAWWNALTSTFDLEDNDPDSGEFSVSRASLDLAVNFWVFDPGQSGLADIFLMRNL